jgi:hypothetical protein
MRREGNEREDQRGERLHLEHLDDVRSNEYACFISLLTVPAFISKFRMRCGRIRGSPKCEIGSQSVNTTNRTRGVLYETALLPDIFAGNFSRWSLDEATSERRTYSTGKSCVVDVGDGDSQEIRRQETSRLMTTRTSTCLLWIRVTAMIR